MCCCSSNKWTFTKKMTSQWIRRRNDVVSLPSINHSQWDLLLQSIEVSGYNSNKQNDPIDDALRGRHALASLPAGIWAFGLFEIWIKTTRNFPLLWPTGIMPNISCYYKCGLSALPGKLCHRFYIFSREIAHWQQFDVITIFLRAFIAILKKLHLHVFG